MTIAFVGHGYVGLVTAAVFADLGNTVWVVGHTPSKIENLKKGILPIYEPGLEELVKRNIKANRLHFTLDYAKAIPLAKVVFIAVGTPPKKNGEADLSVVFDVARKIGEKMSGYTVIATKSTVPVGTNRKIKEIIDAVKPAGSSFDSASVPEFLREGQAISDTLHPDRIVIGTQSEEAKEILAKLHSPVDGNMMFVNTQTAEMIKYAANAMLATKISFANAIAYLSEIVEADGTEVLKAVGLDKRVGSAFLSPGAGYGGSCFPKDVKALLSMAKNHGYDFNLLKEVEKINDEAIARIVDKTQQLLGGSVRNSRIAVLGLAFKPDTDDMRDAPSVTIINSLKAKGAKISVYDPIAIDNAKHILKTIEFGKSPYDVAKNADILVVLTEWNEFLNLDLQKIKSLLRKPIILDGRNIFNPKVVKELGFTYQGVGR